MLPAAFGVLAFPDLAIHLEAQQPEGLAAGRLVTIIAVTTVLALLACAAVGFRFLNVVTAGPQRASCYVRISS
jgi:flagellar basal body-associated protein FliL